MKIGGQVHEERLRLQQSKMTQARKTLELRIEILVNAISECHMAVATRKRWKEIEASMDAVEIAWDRIKRTSSEFSSHDLNLDHLPMMVEMVLKKAEKYLAKAQAKMEKWWEAQVQALEAEKASEVSTVNEVAPEVSTVNAVDEVNKVAPEVSAVDEVNKVALEVSAVDDVNMNKVNEESTINEDSGGVCDAKEEMRKGKSPEVLQKFDFPVKVHMEEFGVKEVMQIDDLKMKEEPRHASWDPGEPVKVEMLDAKEEKTLVNTGKVKLRGEVNWMVFYAAMELYAIVLFNAKEMLVAFSLSRFVNGFRRDCPIELSDYG